MEQKRQELIRALTVDPASAKAEWNILETYLRESSKEEYLFLLAWVFAEYGGYTETRVQAGNIVQQYNNTAWQKILRELLVSEDPDNREVALFSIINHNDISLFPLLISLLNDPWVYIQIEAAEALRNYYPTEVKATLLRLAHHPDTRIQQTIHDLLSTYS